MVRHLVIDAGNTRIKLGLFAGEGLVEHGVLPSDDPLGLFAVVQALRPDAIAWGSVARADDAILEQLMAIAPTLVITGATPAPVRNAYTTKDTLGADRLANAVAAAALFPGRAVLAVDLGTCITYDRVDATGAYLGGAITPGAHMRAKAMHAYSARLPLVDHIHIHDHFATSTAGALQAGIHHGVLGELRTFIASHTHHSPDGAVVLTGGDALPFARGMKSGIFAHPFLTLEGYRLILKHQACYPAPRHPGTGTDVGSGAAG